MNEKQLGEIKKEVELLISDLGVNGNAQVTFGSEEETVNIQLESEQAALLIGFHGETLQALQLISSFIVHKTLGKWLKVSMNIGDYRQKREEQLRKLALSLAQKVKFSNEEQAIPDLSPSERRIIHLTLADHPDVSTVSEGEGRQRQLIIKPKTAR